MQTVHCMHRMGSQLINKYRHGRLWFSVQKYWNTMKQFYTETNHAPPSSVPDSNSPEPWSGVFLDCKRIILISDARDWIWDHPRARHELLSYLKPFSWTMWCEIGTLTGEDLLPCKWLQYSQQRKLQLALFFWYYSVCVWHYSVCVWQREWQRKGQLKLLSLCFPSKSSRCFFLMWKIVECVGKGDPPPSYPALLHISTTKTAFWDTLGWHSGQTGMRDKDWHVGQTGMWYPFLYGATL